MTFHFIPAKFRTSFFARFFLRAQTRGPVEKRKAKRHEVKRHANWRSGLLHAEARYAVAGTPALSLGLLLWWLEEGCEAAGRRGAFALPTCEFGAAPDDTFVGLQNML